MSCIYNNFTNLYSLQKTLRFELIPIGKTKDSLIENNLFQIDENRQKAYENTKPYFDKLHEEFINESLSNVYLDGLYKYFETFKQFKGDKKNEDLQKELDSHKKRLREQIVSFFDEKGKQWALEKYSHLKIKKKDLGLLFEEQVFEILKDRYGKEEKTILVDGETGKISSVFDGWKGFTGYFTKFFETRKNFYKNDGTSTALATRMIDQNLNRFLDNIEIFRTIKNKIDISEVEDFFQLKTDEVFNVDFYNKCLLQNGIDKYNDFLGGKTLDNGEKKKGINEIINKYRQDNKNEKTPFLKKLDKQILSEKEKFIDEIKNDDEFLTVLTRFYTSTQNKTRLLRKLFTEFINNNQQFDLRGIYINKEVFSPYSSRWIAPDVIEDFQVALKKTIKQDSYNLGDFIPLFYIKKTLENFNNNIQVWKNSYYIDKAENNNKSILIGDEAKWEQFLKIFEFEFFSHFKRSTTDRETGVQRKEGYDIFEQKLGDILSIFKIDKGSKVIIKNFADETKSIYQMAKYFALEKKRAWNTEYDDSLDLFYTDPENGYLKFYENAYEEIIQPYNKIRNYLTKKPYGKDKWKLNFKCSYLLSGWSSGFDTYSSLLIKKDEQYYLAIVNGTSLDKETKQKLLQNITSENKSQKLVYDFQKPDNKNVPRIFIRSKGNNFAPAVSDLNLPVQSIIDIYDGGYFKTENRKNPNFKTALIKLIDYFKLGFSKHNSYKHFDFKWKLSSEYKDISEFYEDTIRSCYMLDWEDVNFDELIDLTRKNKLYLFKIYNKDFSKQTKGAPNLHSLYFKTLFLKENLETNDGTVFKLSGNGEIFFRPQVSEDKLGYREDSKGNKIVRNKRYSKNKIFLHFPIDINYARSIRNSFNKKVNNFLANNPDINIIGIDRGEKHLAYYSVIDQKGKMLLDDKYEPVNGSLNFVGKDASGNPIDYHQKLENRAKERKQSQKDWQDIENIKDLKKGYISQVVRKLADLAIKYNAIIVMEDLNMRFKQIRSGIEKSAYQQLEKALIEKLNFLVNKKETDPTKTGHLLRAYQLTAPFETFKDMGKQTGIIFYTQAAYTSKIDPLTGWRPNIYLKYSNADQAKKDISKFTDIHFNVSKDRFEFTYDIKDFSNSKDFPNKTEWTLCSNIERFKWNRTKNNNKGDYDHYSDLTVNLKELFKEYNIDLSNNIIQQIYQLSTKGNEKFFKDFIFYFALVCQIRNTQQNKNGDENDFILSPVEPFFDSRKSNNFGKNLPQNGDDNGAYNIARKGIITLNKISDYYNKNRSTEKMNWNNLSISHTEWDNFATKKQPD